MVDEANEPFPRELHITIAREITTTMSPVLEVTYTDDSGAATKRAVLKLFDRRLGSSLRKVDTMKDPPEREYLPATPETEKAYRSYVQSGKASELWDEIKADMEELVTLGYPEQYYEPTEEGLVRYEGALQHTIQYYFRDEIAAYDKLAHMQGDCIPRMLAHVHLPLTPSSETDDTVENDIENEDENWVKNNGENKVDSKVENVAEIQFERMKEQADGKDNEEFDIILTKIDEAESWSPPLPSPISSTPSTSSSRVPSLSYSISAIEEEIEDTAEEKPKDTVNRKFVHNAMDNVSDKFDGSISSTMDETDSSYSSSLAASSSAGSTTSSRASSSSFNFSDIETDSTSPSNSSASSRVASLTSKRATSPTFDVNDIESKTENSTTPSRSCSSSSSVDSEIVSQVEDKNECEAEVKINHNIEDTAEEKDDDSPFLRVNGVLLEYVSGTPLSDFEDCCPPIETQKWSSILQDVVNTAEKINRAGVLMKDCRSGNVLLRTETWQPVFVDFAHSSVGDFDDEEAEFGASVCYRGNPVCVVRSLVSLGHSRGGVKFNLTYPDYHDLVRKDDSDSREDDCDLGEVDSDSSTRLPRHRSREN